MDANHLISDGLLGREWELCYYLRGQVFARQPGSSAHRATVKSIIKGVVGARAFVTTPCASVDSNCYLRDCTNPWGPCTQILYTLARKYLYRDYIKAMVYAIWVHGPLREVPVCSEEQNADPEAQDDTWT